MTQPTISVVIPLFNKAEYIADAISSVLSQSVRPTEVIVVDDGSTDGGGEAVDRFQAEGVRRIVQPNSGVAAARNAGVRAATSEYVAFLDADDQWLDSHLKVLGQLIVNFPGLGLYSTLHYVRFGGTCHLPRSSFAPSYRGRVDDFFSAMSDGLSLVNSTTACANRRHLLAAGAFPVGVRHGEDIIAWIRLATGFGMAHAAVLTAIYNRDATNRATLASQSEPPGSLLYLAKYIRQQEFAARAAHSPRRLFNRIAFFSAAGMKAAGDWRGFFAICRLAYQQRMYRLMPALMLLGFIPRRFLSLGRRLRHGRISSHAARDVDREA